MRAQTPQHARGRDWRHGQRQGRQRLAPLGALLATMLLATSACAGAGAVGSEQGTAVTVAIVSNPQMKDAQRLATRFEKENPDIHLRFVSLPENEARSKITASVATRSDQFDVVMISNYEAPIWAENGWLTDLSSRARTTPGYRPDDFLPTVRESLSYQGGLYAVPFYGESSLLMYRKDLFAKAGLSMPEQPTWQQVREFAAKLDDSGNGRDGICLRGLPGWGEVLAPLDTVINTFGGRWFDKDWHAQLDSPEVERAVRFYVNLVREYGQPGAPSSGFTECATKFGQGETAMWYDATAAAGTLQDPDTSEVAGKVGYAPAPVTKTEFGGWLYTWSLAIPKVSTDKDAAWKFMSWVTSQRYIRTVGQQLGWNRVPPGSRSSTYEIPQYQRQAKAYAEPVRNAILHADQDAATVKPVPYPGLQFVGIPEFQDLGTRVSQQISAAIAGQITVDEALEQSQSYAESVGEGYRASGGR